MHLEIQGNHATATINNGTITTAATAAVGRASTDDTTTAAWWCIIDYYCLAKPFHFRYDADGDTQMIYEIIIIDAAK